MKGGVCSDHRQGSGGVPVHRFREGGAEVVHLVVCCQRGVQKRVTSLEEGPGTACAFQSAFAMWDRVEVSEVTHLCN